MTNSTRKIIIDHIHKSTDFAQAALSYTEIGNISEAIRQIQRSIDELNQAQLRLVSIIIRDKTDKKK